MLDSGSLLLTGLTDRDTLALFASEPMLQDFIAFEVALAEAQAAENLLPTMAAAAIAAAAASFKPDWQALITASQRDGVPVPEFVQQLRHHIGPPHAQALHFAVTSQDLIDTSLMLALQRLNQRFVVQLAELNSSLGKCINQFGTEILRARTRMQPALLITVADRVSQWQQPLVRAADWLTVNRPKLESLQFGGPVGDRRALQGRSSAVAARLAASLNLTETGCWHTDRTQIMEYGSWLARLSGILGKIGQDIVLMAQPELAEITLTNKGRSSAMPHKQNPVQAENLIGLARYNAAQLAGLHQGLIHEQERSGAAWCLEWLILPAMASASAVGLKTGCALIEQISYLGSTTPGSCPISSLELEKE